MTSQRRGGDGEEGIALFYALLVVLLVGGIIAVTLAAAQTELRQSAFELDFEDAVHVAEAGVELKLQQLSDDNDANDGVQGPTTDARAWALATATESSSTGPCAPYKLCAVDAGEGEVVAIRPTGVDAEYVYSVGFTPSREAWVDGDGEPYARVLRVQVGFETPFVSGEDALRVDGSITSNSSSWSVTGDQGRIHANGAIDIKDDNTTQGITYSGDCAGIEDNHDACAAKGILGPIEAKPIPDLTIEDPWEAAPADLIVDEGRWFDYCGGQWYQRSSELVPCTGTSSVPAPPGWSENSSRLQFDGNGVGDPNAVFWIDDPRTVELFRGAGRLTIIARGDIEIATGANAGPFVAKYPGLVLFTQGDLRVQGNATMADGEAALAYAAGTTTFSGTMGSAGIAYLAKDAVVNSSGSQINGNGTIAYSGGALAELQGDTTPLVLRWEELRR